MSRSPVRVIAGAAADPAAKLATPVTSSVEENAPVVWDDAPPVMPPVLVIKPVTPRVEESVAAPAMFAVVPTYKALAIPTPPEVMMEPVPTEVESVVSVELIPAIKGMREVVVVCPSLVMAVDRPVPKSAVSVLKVVELMTVPATTGCPAVLIKNVPEPLYDILLLLNSVFYYVIYMIIDMD